MLRTYSISHGTSHSYMYVVGAILAQVLWNLLLGFLALARPRHGTTNLPSRHGRPEDPSAASPEFRFRGHRRRATGPALRGGGKLRLFPPEHTGAGRQLQVHARARPVVELTPARAVRSRAATSATAPAAASQARPRRRRLRPRPPPIRPSCLRPPPLRRGLSCAARRPYLGQRTPTEY